MPPGTTLREAFQATDPRPLSSGDPYFVDLSAGRDSRATDYLKRIIENCKPGRFSAVAFSGHRGSGKSTELKQLQAVLSGSCFSLYLDVNEFLDAADVDYTDLFLLLSRRLLEELRDYGIGIEGELLKAVEEWFKSVTNETEETLRLSAGVGSEAKAGIELPFIAKLLAKFTADVKAGSSRKKTTREELDRYFSGLLANTNVLLSAASEVLHKAHAPSQILVLVDNLDRMSPEKSEKLFFSHGSQLQDLACHAVYTISIETYYSHSGIGHVFSNHVLLPNVKLNESKSDPKPHGRGIDAMLEVMRRRLDVGKLLKHRNLANEIVRLSGGSVRQMILILRGAVLNAQSRKLDLIDEDAVNDAARGLRQDFERSLEVEDYGLLAHTARANAIKKNEAYMRLLRNTAIMEYNGKDVWYTVNPLIERIYAYQAATKKLTPVARTRRGRRQ